MLPKPDKLVSYRHNAIKIMNQRFFEVESNFEDLELLKNVFVLKIQRQRTGQAN